MGASAPGGAKPNDGLTCCGSSPSAEKVTQESVVTLGTVEQTGPLGAPGLPVATGPKVMGSLDADPAGQSNGQQYVHAASSNMEKLKVLIASSREDSITVPAQQLYWADWLMKQLWPNVERMIMKIIKEKIEPAINAQLAVLKSLKADLVLTFSRFEMGNTRPKLGPATAYRHTWREQEGIQVDCECQIDCAPNVEILFGGVVFGMKRLVFDGTVSVILKPFVDKPPIIGGFQAFLLNRPFIDFELVGGGGALTAVNNGMIHKIMRKVVLDQVAKFLVLPNRMHFNLLPAKDLPENQTNLKNPRPESILRIQVLSASNLPVADMDFSDIANFLHGKLGILKEQASGAATDPYCEVKLGSQTMKTPTVTKSVNPTWPAEGSIGDFLVYNRDQLVMFDVYDDDFGYTGDDFLGHARMFVRELVSREQHSVPLRAEEYDMRDESSSSRKNLCGSLNISVRHFDLVQAKSVKAFSSIREAYGGPNEGLLGVRIQGLRPMGNANDACTHGDVIVKATLNGQSRTSSQSSKPAAMRNTKFDYGEVSATTMKVVRNMHMMLGHQLSTEAIAEAAELDVSVVENILEMHDMLPIPVNAGFFFLVEDAEADELLIEVLLRPRRGAARELFASLLVPASEILASENMTMNRQFVLHDAVTPPRETTAEKDAAQMVSKTSMGAVKAAIPTGWAARLGFGGEATQPKEEPEAQAPPTFKRQATYSGGRQPVFEAAMELQLWAFASTNPK